MKKLIYVSNSFFPSDAANSVQVIKMCEFFSQYFNVHLLGRISNKYRINKDSVFEIYGIKNDFRISFFKAKKNIIYSLCVIIYCLFSKNSIIYTRSFFVATVISFFSKKEVYFEAHVAPSSFPKYFLTLKNEVKKDNFKIIAISKSLKNILINFFGIEPTKILVAHDAADEKKFNLSLNLPNDQIKPNVGYIGSILPGRGVEMIFELAKRNPNINFNIIGKQNSFSDSLKSNYKLDNVYFWGKVNYNKIQEVFSKQNILLAPYQNNLSIHGGNIDTSSYMSPLKVFEYMASKRAIIISDLPVLREVFTDKSVCFCDQKSILEWDKALNLLLKNKVIYISKVENAHKTFLKNYTIKRRVESIINFMNR